MKFENTCETQLTVESSYEIHQKKKIDRIVQYFVVFFRCLQKLRRMSA
jgi:hypothetical protein